MNEKQILKQALWIAVITITHVISSTSCLKRITPIYVLDTVHCTQNKKGFQSSIMSKTTKKQPRKLQHMCNRSKPNVRQKTDFHRATPSAVLFKAHETMPTQNSIYIVIVKKTSKQLSLTKGNLQRALRKQVDKFISAFPKPNQVRHSSG